MVVEISWLGHAGFKIKRGEGFTIYIDPWNIDEKDKADLIMITHPHYDHLSLDDIKKIQTKTTHILITSDAKEKLKGNVKGVKPGDNIYLRDVSVSVKVHPAYSIDKSYHPKVNEWVGYVLEIDDISIYHSGDTDFIPEMEKIKPYLALLPIGGTYTMGVEDALKAVQSLNPRLVIPMHYGEIVVKLMETLILGEVLYF